MNGLRCILLESRDEAKLYFILIFYCVNGPDRGLKSWLKPDQNFLMGQNSEPRPPMALTGSGRVFSGQVGLG